MSIVFSAKNIQKDYSLHSLGKKSSKAEILALSGVSLEILDGEIIAITGESGSGKSTLLNVLSTIDTATAGIIEYKGKRYNTMSQSDAAKLRLEEFGFVFQKYNLMPTLNIYDNIILPVALMNKSEDRTYIMDICKKLAIEEHLKKMPGQLSGGEQQRVAVARALINRPNVIFADEPTGNLDTKNGNSVFQILLDCAKEEGKTVVFVTHNMELASMADREYVLQDGEIVNERK